MLDEIIDILEAYYGYTALNRIAAIEIQDLYKNNSCNITYKDKGEFAIGDRVRKKFNWEEGEVAKNEAGKVGFLFPSGWLPITTKGVEKF